MILQNLGHSKKTGVRKNSLAKAGCFWFIEEVYQSLLVLAVVAELVDAQR